MRSLNRLLLAALGAALPTACARTPADAAEEAPPGETITVWTDALELFLEHPPLVAGEESAPWAIHLTLLDSPGPVTGGELTLRFTSPDGQHHDITSPAPLRPGIYAPTVGLPAPGAWDLVLAYEGPGLRDEIFIGPVFVYGSMAEVPTEAPEPETGIVLTKEQQWATEFATTPVGRRAVSRTLAAPGELVAPDGREADIAAPLAGLLSVERNQALPSLGARVRRGQVLARLTSAEGEGSWTALQARAERLEREVRRAERLYAVEAIPARRLEEARHDLAVVRQQLDALGRSADSGSTLVIRAPFDGVVAGRHFVVGSRVAPGDRLYTIVDPSTLWARFRVPAEAASRLESVVGGTFTVEGDDRRYRTTRRVAIGPVVDPGHRTLTVVFAVPNPDHRLRAGLLLSGHLALGDPQDGVAVPLGAVRDEDGVAVAYVQVGGELFQRRVLTLGPSDGEWVLILAGVTAGERVVSTGAYQVRLASLNPAAVSDHGHPH